MLAEPAELTLPGVCSNRVWACLHGGVDGFSSGTNLQRMAGAGVRSNLTVIDELKRSEDMRRLNRKTHRRGVVAVEAAIILPIAFVIVVGCTDFARAIHVDMTLANATRVGTDIAATNRFVDSTQTAWEEKVRAAVVEEAASIPSFDEANFSVVILHEDDTQVSGRILVTVVCRYTFQAIVAWPGLPTELLLEHRITNAQFR